MQRNCSSFSAALLSFALLASCSTRDQRRPILIQGAMPVEVEALAGRLENVGMETIDSLTFWRGTVVGYPVVVSKTGKGAANTAAATAIAIDRYHPIAIINEGTAGGHDPALRVGDIVVGRYSVNLGSFKTPRRESGKGSSPLDWAPMDLEASEGSAGQDPNALKIHRFDADPQLLAAARAAAEHYNKAHVVEGTIGSSEVWNSELDRIHAFHERYSTAAEEMETASAAQIAQHMNTPLLGVRVLSNNITNGGTYDSHTAESCQDFVFELVRAYVAAKH